MGALAGLCACCEDIVGRAEELKARAATALPAANDAVVHHSVVCDGCEATPLVGRRFKSIGEDFDLCATCMDQRNAAASTDGRQFEEITVSGESLPLPVNADQQSSEPMEVQARPEGTLTSAGRVPEESEASTQADGDDTAFVMVVESSVITDA